jgi:hypothetical protein
MLSERTGITIGLVITLLGGAGFVTKTYFQTEANAQTLSELKLDIKDEIRALRLELKELRLELKQERVK